MFVSLFSRYPEDFLKGLLQETSIVQEPLENSVLNRKTGQDCEQGLSRQPGSIVPQTSVLCMLYVVSIV